MTLRAMLCVLVVALMLQGCVYRWRAVDASTPDGSWATHVEPDGPVGTSFRVRRRTRIRDGEGATLRVVERCERVRVAGAWLDVDATEVTLPAASSLRLEVQYVDRGLTILHSIVWVLAGAATSFGLLFFTVMMGMVGGGG